MWRTIKPEPGTYALVLASSKASSVRIGGLSILRLQPGFYVYVGSALGPGGLCASGWLRVIGLQLRIAPLLLSEPPVKG